MTSQGIFAYVFTLVYVLLLVLFFIGLLLFIKYGFKDDEEPPDTPLTPLNNEHVPQCICLNPIEGVEGG
ncbi:hypothetical protein CDAR_479201 [Caerostris darwini]|uniref:Uncharacterized protein n=1 Tax=Caerostris darwini TaxID=1538125 RepID=A0AAV4UW86_9ARAC|nr:hypothetical protein CDAR_479201 [Caerostris darwini]